MSVFDPRREEIDRINRLGEVLATGLREALVAHDIDGGVTQCGSLLHLSFDTDGEPRRFSDLNLESRTLDLVHLACMAEGLFIAPRGLMNTSTVMDESVVEEVIARFGRALGRVTAATTAVQTAER
jgi:glutamate-1-semialdehyde 2,1-aminomutase